MDFGVVGLDGLVGSESGFVSLASDPATKQKLYGSSLGFRSPTDEDESRSSKLSKTDDFSSSKITLLRSNNLSSFSDAQEPQQMLSFSSPKSESLLVERSCPTGSIPYFHSTAASARNTGYNSGNMNCGSMYGGLTGIRGPFTPSQWMELEHQALIYKYIAANVAVPSNLLIPIKKALDSAGLSGFPAGFLRPSALGWGTFHMGFSGNSDPEPGRCRRTDGKKWRCARDAVADQKYCERHMNRGRHRSRKPVEGQAGQSVAGISNNNITTTPKLVTSSTASAVDSGAGIPNHLVKNLPPASFAPSGSTQINRMLVEKENGGGRVQNASCFSALSSPENALKTKQASFLIPKPQISYEASPQTGFGLVSGDFLLNPSAHKNSLTTCKSFGEEGETESRFHHFLWPKNQPDRSVLSWSGFDAQSERTQLSISTPMDASDLTSPSSSATPANEKLTLSPLRLSEDFDPIQMGLGVSNAMHGAGSRQANWIPISWGSSMGGPLGEVLNHTNNNGGGECKGSSGLNLMTEGWENSPPIGSSPTGVLQKTSFGSVSTSSTGSSPRAENNRIHEGGILCNDLLGQLL